MRIAIIGLPGSGKSTLFNLLTQESGPTDYSQGNKPRMRTVKVDDARLDRLRDDYSPKKFTPAAYELLDFPAVVREGKDRAGLADLLAPAREGDALVIALCGFRDGVDDRAKDVCAEWDEVLGELVLSDLVIVERRLERLAEKSRRPNYSDAEKRERELLEEAKKLLEAERPMTELELAPEDAKRLSGFGFLSAKARVVVVAWDSGPVPDSLLETLAERCGSEVLAVPARNELEILELAEEDREIFREEYGIGDPSAPRVVEAAYRAAGRLSFFTAGDTEVRAWTIRVGSTAPEAAGAIHTDFERGFIRAEVVSYDDYIADGGIKGAKAQGHHRLEGRDYVVADGDIVEFRFSV